MVDAPEQGVKAEVVFTGRAFPVEEPRFIRRNGPRLMMDYTRLTQNGRYTGWVEVDGKRTSVDGFSGTRDRSWGIRPVGERDHQAAVPPQPPQFYWIWCPSNFASGSFFFHSNDDGGGVPWNRRGVWARDGAKAAGLHEIDDAAIAIDWKSGTRHARRAEVSFGAERARRRITYEPLYEFFMLGLGYGHPKWGHGSAHGELEVERENLVLAKVDRRVAQHLHVQAICKVDYGDDAGASEAGMGVLEQLVIGPHAPSGFVDTLDFAP